MWVKAPSQVPVGLDRLRVQGGVWGSNEVLGIDTALARFDMVCGNLAHPTSSLSIPPLFAFFPRSDFGIRGEAGLISSDAH